MPKRTDLKTILIIGAGPIVIGQACEFDYSGTQACKALKDEGYRIILVNSNPATIMTDPDLAHATYIEPITPEIVAKIIEKERPDAVLPTMGGQTALNTAMALHRDGRLKTHGVELIGANARAIEMAEDRLQFRQAMDRIGLASPEWWRFLEHAFWVLFSVVFLAVSCLRALKEMRLMAERGARGFKPNAIVAFRLTTASASSTESVNTSRSTSARSIVPFSIEQMMMQLSRRSRTTSISYSFQPSTDSSTKTSPTGEASMPPWTMSKYSSRL